ncbi:MAG: sulfurtransferase TusA family protein [Alphaproteobacteria bacterium]
MTDVVDHNLDITQEVCPLTFVKTKLLIERMSSGETAAIRLKGVEPLENVPRSVREHGHQVLSLEAADGKSPPGDDPGTVYILRIRKV